MLKPLQQWFCDECGEIIESPDKGYIEWLANDDHKAHGFRIVHHATASPRHPDGDCYAYTNEIGRSDLSLDCFLGNVGLIRLLGFVDVGRYHSPDYRGPEVVDLREFVELFRRLWLPYYEEARFLFARAAAGGFFGGANEVGIYRDRALKDMISEYGGQD